MNKQDACSILGIVVFDTALPQGFFDELTSVTPSHPLGHFVWSYDDSTLLGAPRPLTQKGVEILKAYNERFGTQYDTNVRVIPDCILF